MGGAVVSRLMILGSGLLYPAYNSYKAVKAASLRDYVRWIMYWVVFALFTAVETFADIFISWFPFYYTVKVVFVLWLVLPYTKGSTLLYRKLIHPNLERHQQEIDMFLENAKDRSYQAVVHVGSRGLNIAANAVVTAAVKSQAVVTDKLKSYSVMDISTLPDDMRIHGNPAAAAGGRQGFRNPQLVRERLHTKPNPASTSSSYQTASSITEHHHHHNHDATGQLSNQFQAYSMFNLSQQNDEFSSIPTNTVAADDEDVIHINGVDEQQHQLDAEGTATGGELNYFDNQVPTHTNDDMRIPRRTNYAQESVAEPDDYATYCRTMPKSSKSTHRHDYKQMPPMPTISHKTKELRRSKRRTKPSSTSEDIKEE